MHTKLLFSVDGSPDGTPISFGQPFAISNHDGTVIYLEMSFILAGKSIQLNIA
jgi:hypothetical protein